MRTCVRSAAAPAVLLAALSFGPIPAQVETHPSDAKVIEALRRLQSTGQPVHADHDEGQLLQWDLDRLVPGNPELLRLARRAAAPITTEINPPIADGRGLPYVAISSRAILQRPEPERYEASIDVSVDGGPWLEFCVLKPDSRCGRNVQQLPTVAHAPGFHQLALRASILHEDGEREIRPLAPLAYGIAAGTERVTGDPGGSPAPAAFLQTAMTAGARDLDPALPPIAVTEWLEALGGTDLKLDALHWRTAWCGLGLRQELAEADTRGICALGAIGTNPPAVVGEVWIRVGSLEWFDGRPQWRRDAPSLERVQIRSGRTSWLPSLGALALAFRQPESEWAAPDVSVDPADITFETTAHNRSTLVRATIRNTGEAPAPGVTIDVLAGTREDRLMLRRFIRDLPVAGSVEVTGHLTYPEGYGWLLIHAMSLSEHAPTSDWSPPRDPNQAVAWRVVNPQIAPPGFAGWVAERICAHQCRGF